MHRTKLIIFNALYCFIVGLYTKGFVYLQIPIQADDYIVGMCKQYVCLCMFSVCSFVAQHHYTMLLMHSNPTL